MKDLQSRVEEILRRNGLFAKYDDSEEGSFSEGEKILSLINTEVARVTKEVIGPLEDVDKARYSMEERHIRNRLRNQQLKRLADLDRANKE